jgi:hypothetical protein
MAKPQFKDEWHDVIDHQDAKIQRAETALRRVRAIASDVRATLYPKSATDAEIAADACRALDDILAAIKEAGR